MTMTPDQIALGLIQFVGLFIPVMLITLRLYLDKLGGSSGGVVTSPEIRAAIRWTILSIGLALAATLLAGIELAAGTTSRLVQLSIVLIIAAIAMVVLILKRLYDAHEINIH